ncbi:IS3 family transposase, partial [Flavobacterium sp. SM15]|uniref:IS3 family transposase n=1 Tax=Flavobacterium sp. SM15 TaxID=2908005 RepID=UPI00351CF6A6
MARNISKRDREKEKKPFKIRWLYQCFGISKQAYYKRIKVDKQREEQAIIIKKLIAPIRKKQTRYGGRKLYLDIKNDLEKRNIKMGRDGFFRFLKAHQLLVKKTKRFHITTDSKHFFYKSPNRIKGITPTHAEQIWVSDITYLRIQDKHAYLALVTDIYSKKIMGFKLDTNMKATLVKDALQMALKNRTHKRENIIHHSDRGIQYCCPEFSDFAKNNRMQLSTTQQYDPYENAVAERINGILKYEFGLLKTLPNLVLAQKMIKQAVNTYNNERRHYSLDMKTPEFAHKNQV